jgi:hypothetical protein
MITYVRNYKKTQGEKSAKFQWYGRRDVDHWDKPVMYYVTLW